MYGSYPVAPAGATAVPAVPPATYGPYAPRDGSAYPTILPSRQFPAATTQFTLGAGRGPLARLVRNANTGDGSPPFALADQAGRIQRLVEPVPGIDLEPFVGQVVVVKHDTGRTILATQLELPPRPLLPMVGSSSAAAATRSAAASPTRQVRFIDDDDTTVQLISDGASGDVQQSAPAQDKSTLVNSSSAAPHGDTIVGDIQPLTGTPSNATTEALPAMGPLFPDFPTTDGLPADVGFGEVCPNCGRQHGLAGCDGYPGEQVPYGTPMGRLGPLSGHCFADVQLNFLRLHLMEGSVGKLGERYELSPRFTLGYDGGDGIGGRVRYWLYDRQTPILGGGGLRVEMNVIDLEATHRFQVGRSDLITAAGFRWAGIDLVDADGDGVGTNLAGLTAAADGHTPIGNYQGGQLAGVYGARWCILGGDWAGSSHNDLVPGSLQDDNVVVESVYVGLQYATCLRNCNLVGRLAFEMQNWHSDVLSQNAGADSLGFFGPGVHVGATF